METNRRIGEEELAGSPYAQKAMALFREGYNCAQAVFLAFADRHGMETPAAARLSASFGGGMGRLREVCGALTGSFMTAGLLYGYDSPEADEEKAAHYARIQFLAKQFEEACGSILCRELLGLTQPGADAPTPAKRTEQYYQTRPCEQLVGISALLLERYMEEQAQ